MDMKVDSKRIRDERTRRAWSQEHLAEVAGLGLRTLQRIEKSALASHESVAALAAVLEVPVAELIATAADEQTLASWLFAKRLWIMAVLSLVAMILSPPNATTYLAATAVLWMLFEVVLAVAQRSRAG
jgi:transcriptional regulator with XRE-family HTH domain